MESSVGLLVEACSKGLSSLRSVQSRVEFDTRNPAAEQVQTVLTVMINEG